MDQISEDNKYSLGKLVEQYNKERKEFPEEGSMPCCCLLRWLKRKGGGSDPSILSRLIKVQFKRKHLLDQEFLFQDKMRKNIRKIIESKDLTESQLKEYSCALKTLNKKYSAENTQLYNTNIVFQFYYCLINSTINFQPNVLGVRWCDFVFIGRKDLN